MNRKKCTLTLGPLLYNWSTDKARDFYLQIADEADIDRVYLGEVVCSKRQPFHETYWSEAVERLERAGKQVVFSSLALVTSPRELRALKELCASDEARLIEINDLTALNAWEGGAFWVGPYVNIYSESTLKLFESLGAVGATLPFELPATSLKQIARSTGLDLEVQVFGRLPLAISARCYHARAYRLHKDNCRFVCSEHMDGMVVDTLDGQPFLTVNGTQTQSLTCVDLIAELPVLIEMGIRTHRLSPQDAEMSAIAALFRSAQDGHINGGEARSRLAELVPHFQFSNGFFHGQEGRHFMGKLEAS